MSNQLYDLYEQHGKIELVRSVYAHYRNAIDTLAMSAHNLHCEGEDYEHCSLVKIKQQVEEQAVNHILSIVDREGKAVSNGYNIEAAPGTYDHRGLGCEAHGECVPFWKLKGSNHKFQCVQCTLEVLKQLNIQEVSP